MKTKNSIRDEKPRTFNKSLAMCITHQTGWPVAPGWLYGPVGVCHRARQPAAHVYWVCACVCVDGGPNRGFPWSEIYPGVGVFSLHEIGSCWPTNWIWRVVIGHGESQRPIETRDRPRNRRGARVREQEPTQQDHFELIRDHPEYGISIRDHPECYGIRVNIVKLV